LETKTGGVPAGCANRKGRVILTLPLSVIYKQTIILRLPSMPLNYMNDKQPKDNENSKAGYSYGREQ
jgi:hypothetical protein